MTGPLDLVRRMLYKGAQWGDNAAPTITHPHIENHIGKAFRSGYLITGVADSGQFNLLMWNPSGTPGKEMHATFELELGGLGYAFIYEGTTVFTTGTVQEKARLNRVREREGVRDPTSWMFAGDATIDELGTQLGPGILIPGSQAATPNAGVVSGNTKGGFEWVLDPASAYLIVVINLSGSTVYGSITDEWYEESQDDFGPAP